MEHVGDWNPERMAAWNLGWVIGGLGWAIGGWSYSFLQLLSTVQA